MFQLHNAVMALTLYDGRNHTYADLCYRTLSGTCSLNGYLDFWDYSFAAFLSSINGSASNPTVGNSALFQSQVSQLTYPDGG